MRPTTPPCQDTEAQHKQKETWWSDEDADDLARQQQQRQQQQREDEAEQQCDDSDMQYAGGGDGSAVPIDEDNTPRRRWGTLWSEVSTSWPPWREQDASLMRGEKSPTAEAAEMFRLLPPRSRPPTRYTPSTAVKDNGSSSSMTTTTVKNSIGMTDQCSAPRDEHVPSRVQRTQQSSLISLDPEQQHDDHAQQVQQAAAGTLSDDEDISICPLDWQWFQDQADKRHEYTDYLFRREVANSGKGGGGQANAAANVQRTDRRPSYKGGGDLGKSTEGGNNYGFS